MNAIIGEQIPYNPDLTVAFHRCDLCDRSEYDGTTELTPLFRASYPDEPQIEYKLCQGCADKSRVAVALSS